MSIKQSREFEIINDTILSFLRSDDFTAVDEILQTPGIIGEVQYVTAKIVYDYHVTDVNEEYQPDFEKLRKNARRILLENMKKLNFTTKT